MTISATHLWSNTARHACARVIGYVPKLTCTRPAATTTAMLPRTTVASEPSIQPNSPDSFP